jgi:hypothetical protein
VVFTVAKDFVQNETSPGGAHEYLSSHLLVRRCVAEQLPNDGPDKVHKLHTYPASARAVVADHAAVGASAAKSRARICNDNVNTTEDSIVKAAVPPRDPNYDDPRVRIPPSYDPIHVERW